VSFILSFRPETLGGNHVTSFSEVTDMKHKHTFCKRTFLNPISTLTTSYIFANVADSQNGAVNHAGNMLIIADCHRTVEFEFYLGDKTRRRQSLAKADLLINFLTNFRDALAKEIELIENFKKSK
jgi:hypothetical protein